MPERTTPALISLAVALSVTACSSTFSSDSDTKQDTSARQHLKVLIASSGDAETKAVKDAADAWATKTGNTVTVDVAKDINQQLAQSFSGNKPPDVFYVDSSQFANYAKSGSLYAYGSQITDSDDFSEQLRSSFTYENQLVCLPKDTSTLALVINRRLWQGAGLTEKDHPLNWDDLAGVSQKLTKGDVTGLVINGEYARIGVFLKESGGWITSPDQREMTADTKENARALSYVQSLLKSGSLKYASQVDTNWGGEALGKGRAAMTIEGNWLAGGMKADYPDVQYDVVPLPEGPEGKGTLAFSQCWGVAQDSAHRSAAVDLVKHFTSAEQQLRNADAFGVMPSRLSAQRAYAERYPAARAWAAASQYAQGPVTLPGFDKVLNQFNTDLAALSGADPSRILADLQRNGEQALAKGE
ncbi:extracellular solute-binding protein [Streptomyces sp. NPDC058739]|uniref:sugar ABC transporter substrate-binding protein n=1 Tax=Streptomyces sp. NPDC058739 TaxID=3346618 RepID=UPI0036C2250F